ncbi:PepSY domain-containing protein [Vibrio sinus]|uniref:PepSY domain-containing protein n=1 Tax=Vibrio sinus TaxID=2946865 RepID=UPI003D6E1843
MRNITILSASLIFGMHMVPAYADPGHQNGHELVQDTYKPGTSVKFDEDQDEVYDAVQKGLIKPFSELYDAVDTELNGRVIKVELEEDDGQWFYELKLVHNHNVVKVKYNATTLALMEVKGHNILEIIKR